MSKKADPTKIGLFIVLGLSLIIIGIVTFSSTKIFSERETYILYFDASVKGLNPGAPVKFRGVTIGNVVEVLIRFNQAEDDLHMPVIIEINEDVLREKSDRSIDLSNEQRYQESIERGLHGMLEAQSLVTGLLYVELGYLENKAQKPTFHQLKRKYREIPTASTEIQQLMDNLARIDLGGITEKLNSILAKIDDAMDELHMRDITHSVTNLLNNVNTLVSSPEITNTVVSARETLEEFRALSVKIRSKVDPLSDSAAEALKEVEQTLTQIRNGIQGLEDLLAPEAPMRGDLHRAIDELAKAGRSISSLAEFLRRNPRALISGRKQEP